MDHESLRLLIREKLGDGRLPQECAPKIWSSASKWETCGGCDETIEARQMSIDGIDLAGGRVGSIQLHVECFYLWNAERP
jgi:hypothetical protein